MPSIDALVSNIRENVKSKAIVACSGGIDSTLTSYLVQKAIPDKSLTVFVDTGLLRENEVEKVRNLFEKLQLNYKILNESDFFIKSLKGIKNPESKRKIIGSAFIKSFEKVAKEFGAEYLIQGTIAPDWIESGDEKRDNIKSHHNVGGLPRDINLKIYEPIRDLYKDEVRALSKEVGINPVSRQPFPGPGLAIRVIGSVTKKKIDIIRGATKIVEEVIEQSVDNKLMPLPWQYFPVLLPIKSVGVMGDRRSYGYTISIRIVESLDAMTANICHVPYEILEEISSKICSSYSKYITRVLFDITSKPPSTIEWE